MIRNIIAHQTSYGLILKSCCVLEEMLDPSNETWMHSMQVAFGYPLPICEWAKLLSQCRGASIQRWWNTNLDFVKLILPSTSCLHFLAQRLSFKPKISILFLACCIIPLRPYKLKDKSLELNFSSKAARSRAKILIFKLVCSRKGRVTGGNIMNSSLDDFPLLGKNNLLLALWFWHYSL